MFGWLENSGLLMGIAAPPAPSVAVENVWDFVVKGGWMMIPIGLCSLIAMTVAVERIVSLRRSRVIPSAFLPGLRAVMKRYPAEPKRLLEHCRRDGSPVANVFAAGLRRLGASIESIEHAIQESGQREVLKLRKHLRVLSVIAAVSPLLGLLGTIFGMIIAFQTVATSAEALGKTELLAGGIYQAMITTAAGLIVAIPALVGYHWLAARVQRLVMDIDLMTVEFFEDHASAATLVARAAPTLEPAKGAPETAPPYDGIEAGVAAT